MGKIKGQCSIVELRPVAQHEMGERPEASAEAVKLGFGIAQLDAQPLMHVFVKVFEQHFAGVVHPRLDAFVHFGLERFEGSINFRRCAALLINGENALFKIDAGFNTAQDVVGGAKDAAEQVEFLGEQFQHTAVGLVAFVEEVDHHDIMLLPVAVASADALLHPLRIPGQVVIDDQRTKLDIDTFCGGFGGNQDAGLIAEVFYQRGANVDVAGACNTACASIGRQPVLINGSGFRTVVAAAELHDLAGVAMGYQIVLQVNLGAARFGENQRLALCAGCRHLLKADFKGGQQAAGFGVSADAARPIRQLCQ